MYNINTSVDLSKYEKIGSKILKSCEIEQMNVSLLMRKFEK